MNNYERHAYEEFRVVGWTDDSGKFYDEMQETICREVLALLRVLSSGGHSGTSASYTINLFKSLASFEPIAPLTGEDWEWVEIGDGMYQNKRCARVFKDAERFNGQAYDIDAAVFWEWVGEPGDRYKSYYTNSESAKPIIFPYTPNVTYIERPSQLERVL